MLKASETEVDVDDINESLNEKHEPGLLTTTSSTDSLLLTSKQKRKSVKKAIVKKVKKS